MKVNIYKSIFIAKFSQKQEKIIEIQKTYWYNHDTVDVKQVLLKAKDLDCWNLSRIIHETSVTDGVNNWGLIWQFDILAILSKKEVLRCGIKSVGKKLGCL